MPELNYPTQYWQRLWTTENNQYLGQTTEDNIQFDNNWGTETVAFDKADDITLTSSRTITLTDGTYTFTVGSDDGFRLYIDGQLVMEDWIDHSYKTESATKTLTEGQHQIRLDFYENTGNARLSFEYQQQQTTSTMMPELNYPTQYWQRLWTTENNQYLGQTTEDNIQFDNNWGTETVAFDKADDITLTSSRTITLTDGTYTFTVGSDDGFRLYIDGQRNGGLGRSLI